MDAPPSYDDAEKGGKGVTFSCPAESMSQWLANHQLDRYRDAFERGGFNSIEDLMNAKEDDLDALGLALGHKRRFLAAVSRTRMGGVGVPAPAYSEVQGETKKVEVDLSGTSAYIRDHLTDSMGMTYDHDGKGTYINLVGNSYRGGHNHGGFFHGRGIYTYTNGETYDGGWVDGKREGFGRATFADGRVIEGIWMGNLPPTRSGLQPAFWGQTDCERA